MPAVFVLASRSAYKLVPAKSVKPLSGQTITPARSGI
jgi:hypothetical protein